MATVIIVVTVVVNASVPTVTPKCGRTTDKMLMTTAIIVVLIVYMVSVNKACKDLVHRQPPHDYGGYNYGYNQGY